MRRRRTSAGSEPSQESVVLNVFRFSARGASSARPVALGVRFQPAMIGIADAIPPAARRPAAATPSGSRRRWSRSVPICRVLPPVPVIGKRRSRPFARDARRVRKDRPPAGRASIAPKICTQLGQHRRRFRGSGVARRRMSGLVGANLAATSTTHGRPRLTGKEAPDGAPHSIAKKVSKPVSAQAAAKSRPKI